MLYFVFFLFFCFLFVLRLFLARGAHTDTRMPATHTPSRSANVLHASWFCYLLYLYATFTCARESSTCERPHTPARSRMEGASDMARSL